MTTPAHFLPASLQERLRPQHGATLPAPRDAGAHVLYCMRTAYRSAANPSLETALRVANELRVPLLCLAVLEDSFPAGLARIGMRPTDRATAFRLEALRELQPEIAARGSVLLVHVERDGSRQASRFDRRSLLDNELWPQTQIGLHFNNDTNVQKNKRMSRNDEHAPTRKSSCCSYIFKKSL